MHIELNGNQEFMCGTKKTIEEDITNGSTGRKRRAGDP